MSELVPLGPEFTQLLDWFPAPAFVQSRQGTLQHVNTRLRAITGAAIEKYIGHSVAELLPEEIVGRVAEEDRRVLAGETVHSELIWRVPGSAEATLFVSKSKAQHAVWGDVIVGLAVGGTQLQRDLYTPLRTIAGLADELLATSLRAEQRDSLRLIRLAAGAGLTLLTDQMAGTRRVELSIREFLDAVLKPFELRAGSRRVSFRWSIDDDVPELVYCDPRRLQQVLEDLADNAVKFTEAGAVEVRVASVADFSPTAGIQFSLGDTGIGISKEKLAIVFDCSGLARASSIVNALGGRIWAESEPSRGSVFSFVIPTPKLASGSTGATAGDGLDRRSALAIAGGDETLLKELAELFLQEYPRLIADLRTASQERDSKKLDAAAHALKGAVANFGARGAVEAALVLEAKGRAGKLEGVEEALRSLEEILDPLLVELATI